MYIADASTLIDNTLKKSLSLKNGHPTLSELKLETLVSEVAGKTQGMKHSGVSLRKKISMTMLKSLRNT